MFSSLQKQFTSYWKRQSLGKQITMVSLILAVSILVPVLVNWANSPSYSVAYNGLSEADAAQIVQKLDENNIPYQLKNSGTIEVPNDQVYTVRLLMAREGLPQSSTVGYELFSGSSTLGMTEFSQQVNYQRAIEGELQRTIGSLEAVKAVRVHLVIPEKSLLSSDQALTTASVTIQINPGHTLDGDQVRSITHLVAKPTRPKCRSVCKAFWIRSWAPIALRCKPPWKWTGLNARSHPTRMLPQKSQCAVRKKSMKAPPTALRTVEFQAPHRTCQLLSRRRQVQVRAVTSEAKKPLIMRSARFSHMKL
jgi:type III secretory pathway lipoprotein EscJ